MRSSDLDYDLPPDRIATQPAQPRDSAKLMVVRRATDTVEHRRVRDLADTDADLLRAGDLLVLNRSRVLPASFIATRVATGGKVTGLFLRCEEDDDRLWRVMLESRGRLRPGEHIALDEAASLELLDRLGDGAWSARLTATESTLDLLTRIGATPLPPYIKAARRRGEQAEVSAEDQARYNTVYAADPGSVAAPTAGLHFTDDLLARIQTGGVRIAFVTLHVGLGTFAPVRTEELASHRMHSEWMRIPGETIRALDETRAKGGRIIPVGTTSVRALESLPAQQGTTLPDEDYTSDTDLFIAPSADGGPFPFRFTDALMTNFHLPRSTLLALVAALPGVGVERLKRWYAAAIENGYRFYSYGDAMLVI